MQNIQDKCVLFCLQLDGRSFNKVKEIKKTNWLPVSERLN